MRSRTQCKPFFDLLSEETESAARAVLGHFIFVFIHPYADGNGRMARFLMNALLIDGGFPWTTIHLEHRARYIDALEEASVNGDIKPFTAYVRDEMLGPIGQEEWAAMPSHPGKGRHLSPGASPVRGRRGSRRRVERNGMFARS